MSSAQVVGWGECSLETCSVDLSIFKYRPSLAASGILIALFGLSAIIHAFQGLKYRQWTFAILMAIGCLCEIVGYGGRIILNSNPWSFGGFIMQIVCITIAPVFFTAAIYIILYKSVQKLDLSSARFNPKLYYQIFIPCDVISLVIQSVGGAMSASSMDPSTNQAGVNIGIAGLSFQVFTLCAFIGLSVDYAVRYIKSQRTSKMPFYGLDNKFKIFLAFLSLATLSIFIRCAYRIYELSDGYTGTAIHQQWAFFGLESCTVIAAVIFLNLGHPGLAFDGREMRSGVASDSSSEELKEVADV